MDHNREYAGIKVLIVDDHAMIRRLLGQIMFELGIGDFQTAENGENALQVMETFCPDVVLVDQFMEPMDGLGLTKAIRSGMTPCHAMVPIIMVSAETSRDVIENARDAGVNEFLAKPLTIETVLKRLQAVIKNPRQFVTANDYYGPDRRRRRMNWPRAERRQERATARMAAV